MISYVAHNHAYYGKEHNMKDCTIPRKVADYSVRNLCRNAGQEEYISLWVGESLSDLIHLELLILDSGLPGKQLLALN